MAVFHDAAADAEQRHKRLVLLREHLRHVDAGHFLIGHGLSVPDAYALAGFAAPHGERGPRAPGARIFLVQPGGEAFDRKVRLAS